MKHLSTQLTHLLIEYFNTRLGGQRFEWKENEWMLFGNMAQGLIGFMEQHEIVSYAMVFDNNTMLAKVKYLIEMNSHFTQIAQLQFK
jgi:hypothetical protein